MLRFLSWKWLGRSDENKMTSLSKQEESLVTKLGWNLKKKHACNLRLPNVFLIYRLVKISDAYLKNIKSGSHFFYRSKKCEFS